MATDFFGYLDDITDGATRAQIATVAGVSASTITRWDPTRPDHIKPRADAVIAIAQHYGTPPLEALIAAGILTAADARVRETTKPLSTYPHAALLRELQHRLDAQSSDPSTTIPAEEEDPNPDDFDLAAGHVERPDDRPAD
ncbi:helix-turn-helix domain-containing protein [Brachybacterium sp. NBEC-018]|uniref:helix-turn-helix domain-containing protein n=1 Tax=Brachybacterium sp. NBEC-018 TaxID=2996004 RepID=UPI002174EDC7|nr:helix-turn-helix transcriptional regulator [Brachybacterium sp. NBEC-018]UVY83839.1 helix-turn-helix domain-containing protein [Brachybacterium sp. NBEC-018]